MGKDNNEKLKCVTLYQRLVICKCYVNENK